MLKGKNNDTQTDFKKKVADVVRKIPRGKTKSYAEVAKLAGSPKAYRAVASVMSNNYDPTIPCHRVIKSNGEVGDYNRGGAKAKLKLLEKEKHNSK